MRVAICGASGFLGTYLSRKLVNDGFEVVRISKGHFEHNADIAKSLLGCEIVINFCGASIAQKWDEMYKHELYVSRVETTKKLIKEIANLEVKPKLFISASSTGIYEDGEVHDGDSKKYGTCYLSLLAKEWEAEAKKAEKFGVRTVILRLAPVVGKEGGVIEEMKKAFKFGIGLAPMINTQPFPWVHIDDVIEVTKRAIEDENMQGLYNLVAPDSVSLRTFFNCLGKQLGRPVLFKLPLSIMKFKYAEGAEALLRGAFVIPKRLEEEGYQFKYKNLNDALKAVL